MFVYLAGPITSSHGFTGAQNMQVATDIYFDLMFKGINVFCPHLNSAFPKACDVGYERWMEYGFALIDLASIVLMLPRWQESRGAWREHEYALRQGKPVAYSLEELLRILGKTS